MVVVYLDFSPFVKVNLFMQNVNKKLNYGEVPFYVFLSGLLGIISVLFSNYVQYVAPILLAILLAVILISMNTFYVLIFLVCWLPLQNFVAMCLVGFFGFPYEIVKAFVAAKEVIALTLIIYLVLKGRVNILKFKFVDFCFLFYFLWTTVYLILPGSFFPVSADWIARSMGYRAAVVPVVLYFIGRSIPISRSNVIFLIKLVIRMAVFASLFGIFERFFLPVSFWHEAGIGQYEGLKTRGGVLPYGQMPGSFYSGFGERFLFQRLASTYVGSLAFGFAHIFVIALLIGIIGCRRKIGILMDPLKKYFTFCVVFVAQLLTITRAAIIANFLSLGVFFLYSKKVKLKILFFAMPFILFIIFSPISRKAYESTVTFKDYSAFVHIREIKNGYENFKKYPMGIGLGCGGSIGRAYNTSLAGENLYFAIGVERGIIGLLLFFLMSLALIKFCHKNRKHGNTEPLLFMLIYPIIISTLGYLVASVTTEHWQAFVSSGVYWIFAGITVQAIIKYKKFGEI